MSRVKRGTIAIKRRRKTLKLTKGYRWGRKSKERAAKEALLHALPRKFRGRKEKKRNFRALWNTKINAGARIESVNYSTLMGALKRKKILLNRKMLSELAETNPEVFSTIVKQALS